MLEDESIREVASYLEIALTSLEFSANRKKMAEKINEWIQNDFQRLISVLYQLDVSEDKLKNLLKENQHGDAGVIITDMIVERQLQKIRSRQQFPPRGQDIDENDKW